MAASKNKIVVLGASYAGISTAHYLLKHAIFSLPDSAKYELVLVSPSSEVICRPACPRAMISDSMFDQTKLFVDIVKQFEQYPADSFRFIKGHASLLDHSNRTVQVSLANGTSEKLQYHVLVIATGAASQSPLFGFTRDEKHLRESWSQFRKALPQAKSIVIAGGGPTGVETAGELGEYLNGPITWFGVKPEQPKVHITLVTSGSQILPLLRPSLAAKAENYLEKVGVTVLKKTRIQKATPEGAGVIASDSTAVLELDDGRVLEADLYIVAAGTRPNTEFVHADLLSADGRIKTNCSTLRVDGAGARVYAIGDASSYARQAVHHILEAVPVMCANIKKDLLQAAGSDPSALGPDRQFVEDTRETQMVPIGKSKGVGSAMGYALPSWLVWLIKGRDYWLWTTGNLWSGKQWAKEK